MTQTTETTQQAGETTQPTSQPTTATQPEKKPEQAEPVTVPKSAFITDGKLAKPTANSQEPKASTTPPPLPKSVFLSNGELSQIAITPEEAEKTTIKATSKPASTEESDLKAQLTALQARLDAMESQRTTETRTAEVERIIAPLSDTLKAVYRRTPFATLTDDEFAQLRETISKEVTELATADKARGAVFSRPTASKPTDGKASDKETEEVLRRLNL